MRNGEKHGKGSYIRQLTCPLLCFVFHRNLGVHGYLIEGTVTLAKENLNKSIPYKYWVGCGEGEYEFIYKHSVGNHHVNRHLLIRSNLLNDGGELPCLHLQLGVIHGVFCGGKVSNLYGLALL